MVSRKTKYVKPDRTSMTLDLGLGESISVDAIIGLPTLKEWKVVIDMDLRTAILYSSTASNTMPVAPSLS